MTQQYNNNLKTTTMEGQLVFGSKTTADTKFSQRFYSEEEVIEFARRMMFEIVLGNYHFLHDAGAVRAKLPPTA